MWGIGVWIIQHAYFGNRAPIEFTADCPCLLLPPFPLPPLHKFIKAIPLFVIQLVPWCYQLHTECSWMFLLCCFMTLEFVVIDFFFHSACSCTIYLGGRHNCQWILCLPSSISPPKKKTNPPLFTYLDWIHKDHPFLSVWSDFKVERLTSQMPSDSWVCSTFLSITGEDPLMLDCGTIQSTTKTLFFFLHVEINGQFGGINIKAVFPLPWNPVAWLLTIFEWLRLQSNLC